MDYLIALYGWIFFNLLLLAMAKDKEDNKKKRFNFKVYWRYHWDNVAVTFCAIPIIVIFTDDLWRVVINGWFSKNIEYSELSLLGAVPFVQLIYYIVRKFSN